MRESSSLTMIPFLSKKGAKIRYYDPTGKKNEFKNIKNVSFCNSIKSACNSCDLIIIHTEWNDFKSLNFKNFIVYDMRNIYSPKKMFTNRIKYFGIGR